MTMQTEISRSALTDPYLSKRDRTPVGTRSLNEMIDRNGLMSTLSAVC